MREKNFIFFSFENSVPVNVLILKGRETMECLKVVASSEKDKQAQRLAIRCLATVLSVQPGQVLQQYKDFIFHLFSNCMSEDSKVRKSCKEAIVELMSKKKSDTSRLTQSVLMEFCDHKFVHSSKEWKHLALTLELIKACGKSLGVKVREKTN